MYADTFQRVSVAEAMLHYSTLHVVGEENNTTVKAPVIGSAYCHSTYLNGHFNFKEYFFLSARRYIYL